MEFHKTCIQCKLTKPLNDFERFGSTFRRVCRSCRGSLISGLNVNSVSNIINHSTTKTETNLHNLESRLHEHISIIEQHLNSLKLSNLDLLEYCKSLTNQNTFLLQQNEHFTNNLYGVISRLDDLIVTCRDPNIQSDIKSISNDIRALSNSIDIIHRNTKSISRTTSPVASPSYRN